MARAQKTGKLTRIQREKREQIFEAALEVFSQNGLRGATLEQISNAADMSKPHILYYFDGKETIYTELLEHLLETWLAPLKEICGKGDPIDEILSYALRKIEMSRTMPRESRLFSTEMIQNAPHILSTLKGELKELVDEKATLIHGWASEGRIADVDAYHLFFSIWAMTQHYADFDVQVQAVLGPTRTKTRFNDAEHFVSQMLRSTLEPSSK